MSDCQQPCMLSQVDEAIEQMERFKTYLDNAFIALQNATQDKVDEIIVNDINPYINQKLADLRESLLSSMQEQYKAFKEFSESLNPIYASDPSSFSVQNFNALIDWCIAVKDFLTKAYNTLQQFLTLLPTHLARLTEAITDIVTYTPPSMGVSFDKLEIHMEPISMSDITGE